jgi:hypothetical protein
MVQYLEAAAEYRIRARNAPVRAMRHRFTSKLLVKYFYFKLV